MVVTILIVWFVGANAVSEVADIWRCPVRLLDVGPSTPTGNVSDLGGAGTGDAGATKPLPTERLNLMEDGLDYLGSLRSPLYLVPALGVYRGGKSLLLNRLMGLKAPYEGGFGVGHAQQTFTRGVDVCGEEVPGLGTVVWMDTEGLFSAEDARSAYGPKIFSLALLFSSAVLLNSVKVLNEQFFGFFAEQQQIARVLRQGLASEGMRPDALLPRNLHIRWVLQQPIHYSGFARAGSVQAPLLPESGGTNSQLEAFLALEDETRSRVRRDFNHSLHEVPAATHDVRQWGILDRLGDDDLLPEYMSATDDLRASLLSGLEEARPVQAHGIAKQLRMYAELVHTEQFSGSLVKEAFEEAEISTLCEAFIAAAADAAGVLPNSSLSAAIEVARVAVQPREVSVVEDFHFNAAWRARLERCYLDRITDLERQNAEQVLLLWQAAVAQVAEEGTCFFLGKLAVLLKEYATTYGPAFSKHVQARAVDYGSALQRTRLVECVRLRDFIWPLVPWLAWPICKFYLRGGVLSGLVSMALHAVLIVGVYAVLQFLNQLPGYLDVDYPVLRKHPFLLDVAMRAPPMVPWGSFGKTMGVAGAARSCWKLLKFMFELGKPPGHAHTVSQLLNLELKVNAALKRSEAALQHELVSCALEAANRLERFELRPGSRALLKGLSLVRDSPDDRAFKCSIDSQLHQRVVSSVRQYRAPLPGPMPSTSVAARPTGANAKTRSGVASPIATASVTSTERLLLDGGGLAELVARDDMSALVDRMAQLLDALPSLALPGMEGGAASDKRLPCGHGGSQVPLCRRSHKGVTLRSGVLQEQRLHEPQSPCGLFEKRKVMGSDSSEPESGPPEEAEEPQGARGDDMADIVDSTSGCEVSFERACTDLSSGDDCAANGEPEQPCTYEEPRESDQQQLSDGCRCCSRLLATATAVAMLAYCMSER